MKYVKPYLIFTALVWLPWGLICIFNTGMITDVIGVSGLSPSGTTDMRAMYGGFQTAVGLMALLALYDQRYLRQLLVTLAFMGSCLALSRSYGLYIDGSASIYTFGVLSYETFAAISSMVFLKLSARTNTG